MDLDTKPSILIIDDDLQMRVFLRNLLGSHGYKVIEASNGHVGSRLYREEPTDLIITDIFMPDGEGLEMIKQLRCAFPGAKIIAISGGMHAPHYDPLPIARALGALRTFVKPFAASELVRAVREALGGSTDEPTLPRAPRVR